MEVSRPIELGVLDEIRILQNVRLINRRDLNHVRSKDNLRVVFTVTGEVTGSISCYLCLDGHSLNSSDRNYLFPLFVEAMNILIGRQITLDRNLGGFRLRLSSPKLSMLALELDTALRSSTQKYSLELDHSSFSVLTEYSLEAIN